MNVKPRPVCLGRRSHFCLLNIEFDRILYKGVLVCFKALSWNSPEGLRKTVENLSIVDVPVSVRTQHLPSARQKTYHVSQLAGSYFHPDPLDLCGMRGTGELTL